MIRFSISLVWLLLAIFGIPGSSAYSETPTLSRQPGLRVKSIYIDPWYGGKALGPRLSENKYGKEVTLEIAKRLKVLLETNGFAVYLSRSNDQFITEEKRTVQAKQMGADIYLKININNQKKECIDICLLALDRSKRVQSTNPKTKEEFNAELDRIVADLKVDDKQDASLMIAGAIAKQFKSNAGLACVQLLKRLDYVLINAPMPAVSVEFGVSSGIKKPSYILDATIQDRVIQSLADAIKDYANESAPKIVQ